MKVIKMKAEFFFRFIADFIVVIEMRYLSKLASLYSVSVFG